MRIALFAAATLAIAFAVSPDTLRSALATSASALFEATPFLLAGVVLARLLRGRNGAIVYLGCGCGSGPSARSLPAAAAAWLVFGPLAALGRLAAAIAVGSMLHRRCAPGSSDRDEARLELLPELSAVLPAALLAGVAMQLAGHFDPRHAPPFAQVAAGLLLGFTSAPCALGAIALAGALHIRAPLAATAFLCVAGIADVRALCRRRHRHEGEHDALAYALLALALGIVAWRHGDALVHPAIGAASAACALAAAIGALRHRGREAARMRIAPAIMLLGALVNAPPPHYAATETTLTDLFPGEHLAFTGTLTHGARDDALVRYAITCCRADAAPVAVRLERVPQFAAGTWLHVDGTIVGDGDELRLRAERIRQIAPPADPFIYR